MQSEPRVSYEVHCMNTNSCSSSLDWPQEEAEQAAGTAANGDTVHLWEESWDDDDAAEDFSKQLKCVSFPFELISFNLFSFSPCSRFRLTA